MYGNSYHDNNSRAAAALVKCNVGAYLENFEAISRFVRQRYLGFNSLVLVLHLIILQGTTSAFFKD